MNETTTIDINAGLDRAWAELTAVATWPRWTASVRSVERLDDGPLRVGSRAKVKQPGMLPLVWEVTEMRDRESFVWVAKSPGVRTVGVHRIAPNPDGSTRLTLEIQQDGPLAGMVGAMIAGRTRRFMALEAAGLKAATEA